MKSTCRYVMYLTIYLNQYIDTLFHTSFFNIYLKGCIFYIGAWYLLLLLFYRGIRTKHWIRIFSKIVHNDFKVMNLKVHMTYLLFAFWTFFDNSSVKASFSCNSPHSAISLHFNFFFNLVCFCCTYRKWLLNWVIVPVQKRALTTGTQDYLLSLWRFLAWLPHNNCFAVSN